MIIIIFLTSTQNTLNNQLEFNLLMFFYEKKWFAIHNNK